MVIVIDPREQLPYTFLDLDEPGAIAERRGTLNVGDYSVLGLEARFAIERKSLADAYGTFGAGRDRFERELERAREFDYFAILIESCLVGLRTPPRHVSVSPATIINSLVSWSVRHRIPVWLVNDREQGRRMTYALAVKFREQAIARGVFTEAEEAVLAGTPIPEKKRKGEAKS